MTRLKPDSEMLARLLAEPDPEPDDLEALDAAWEEEEVLFGPAASDPCGRDRLIPKLRQARRPAPGLEPVAGAGPRTLINTPKTHSIGENL
jgi:nitrate reductase delta subunit